MLSRIKKVQNNKGQIAVFLLLAFQFLFILFAMTLNVALTVHDKINLQNSADLAAFYGAKKQAEVLNAIAHINYQMRQNYKLLAWRYRILGSLVQRRGLGRSDEAWCPKPKNTGSPYSAYNCTDPYTFSAISHFCINDPYDRYCDSNFTLCFSADLWVRGIHSGENNLCTNQKTPIPRPSPVPVIAPFISINWTASIGQMNLISSVDRTCNGETVINWLMGQLFLSEFRLDQKDRKMMIRALYNATLKQGKDLDGKSIEEGAKKTFEKNLTWINKQNIGNPDFKFEGFNSLAGKSINDLLKPIYIFPILEYLSFTTSGLHLCSNDDRKYSNETIAITPDDVVNQYRPFINQWMSLFNYNKYIGSPSSEQFLLPLALGYEKEKDQRVYYGVSVTLPQTSSHQLFSPFTSGDSLILKASAFAKPFGGRIGPPKDPYPDPLLKNQIAAVTALGGTAHLHPWDLKPNHSRFPGDKWGLIDREVHPSPSPNNPYGKYYLLKKEDWNGPNNPFNVNHYSNLIDHDPLASNGNAFFVLRMMELMAVAPDVFDVMNYSFFNNYMQTYFPKIKQLIGGSGGNQINPSLVSASSSIKGFIRGDFGHPYTDKYAARNKTFRRNPSSLVPFFFLHGTVRFNNASHVGSFAGLHALNNLPPYIIKDPAHFLTGFMPTTSQDRYAADLYGTPPDTFMKCYETTKDGFHIPSGCAVGGRSGYSVKLVSCDIIQSLPGITSKPTDLSDNYCQ